LAAAREVGEMAIGINDIVRVTAHFSKDLASDVINTFHWKITNMGTADQEDMETFLKGTLELVYASMVPFITSTVGAVDINLFNVTQNEPYGSSAWPTIVGGTATGEELPNQNSPYTFGRTPHNGVISRKYLPVTVEGNQNDGVLESAIFAGLVAFTQEWIDSWSDTTSGAQMIPGVVRSVAPFIGQLGEIISGVSNGYLHTLRNRRPGVGS